MSSPHMSSYKLCWVQWEQFKAVCDIKIFLSRGQKNESVMRYFFCGALSCTRYFINRYSSEQSLNLLHIIIGDDIESCVWTRKGCRWYFQKRFIIVKHGREKPLNFCFHAMMCDGKNERIRCFYNKIFSFFSLSASHHREISSPEYFSIRTVCKLTFHLALNWLLSHFITCTIFINNIHFNLFHADLLGRFFSEFFFLLLAVNFFFVVAQNFSQFYFTTSFSPLL